MSTFRAHCVEWFLIEKSTPKRTERQPAVQVHACCVSTLHPIASLQTPQTRAEPSTARLARRSTKRVQHLQAPVRARPPRACADGKNCRSSWRSPPGGRACPRQRPRLLTAQTRVQWTHREEKDGAACQNAERAQSVTSSFGGACTAVAASTELTPAASRKPFVCCCCP